MPVRKQPKDPFEYSSQMPSPADRRQQLSRYRARAHSQNETHQPSLGTFVQKNIKYIMSVVIVVLVVAFGMIVLAPLVKGNLNPEDLYVSPYDWTKLEQTGDRYSYVVDDVERSRLGIDVSENQHWIDWGAVAADGIDFAMIRLGYRGATAGDLYLDEYYHANLEGARAAGIDRGVYFFSQATTPEEAREEADFVLTYLNGTDLEYPVVFDSEEKVLGITQARTHGLDKEQMTAIAEAFCERIEEAGYDTMVYGNRHDIARYERANMETRDLWWAEYGVPTPTAKIDFVVWQYTNTGSVNGIDGEVDMNIDLTHVLD